MPTIPSRLTHRVPAENAGESYRALDLVKNTFANIEQFCGIATRHCKLEATFSAIL